MLAALEDGADGLFFATQEASREVLAEAEFLALGKPCDLEIPRSVEGRCALNLLHVCRTNIMADLAADYPAHAVNWESQRPNPSLEEARRIWPYTLVGGLDRNGPLANGTPAEVVAEVRRAVARVDRQARGGDGGPGLGLDSALWQLRAASASWAVEVASGGSAQARSVARGAAGDGHRCRSRHAERIVPPSCPTPSRPTALCLCLVSGL